MLERLRRGYSAGSVSEVGDRLSRLCSLLAESDIPAGGETIAKPWLAQITALVWKTQGDEEELRHALDELDKAMAAANYGHLTRSTRGYVRLPGDGTPRQIEVMVCPAPHRCSRAVRATDTEDARCVIIGQALKKIRLAP